MNWKTSLDKYLTTPPTDGFDDFCENTQNCFTDDFYDSYEDWIMQYGGICSKWLEKLYKKGLSPSKSAAIIERAYYLYL